jgi:uncharacterized paraquat-inducible protein A
VSKIKDILETEIELSEVRRMTIGTAIIIFAIAIISTVLISGRIRRGRWW